MRRNQGGPKRQAKPNEAMDTGQMVFRTQATRRGTSNVQRQAEAKPNWIGVG